jgi:hypothetical protein
MLFNAGVRSFHDDSPLFFRTVSETPPAWCNSEIPQTYFFVHTIKLILDVCMKVVFRIEKYVLIIISPTM